MKRSIIRYFYFICCSVVRHGWSQPGKCPWTSFSEFPWIRRSESPAYASGGDPSSDLVSRESSVGKPTEITAIDGPPPHACRPRPCVSIPKNGFTFIPIAARLRITLCRRAGWVTMKILSSINSTENPADGKPALKSAIRPGGQNSGWAGHVLAASRSITGAIKRAAII